MTIIDGTFYIYIKHDDGRGPACAAVERERADMRNNCTGAHPEERCSGVFIAHCGDRDPVALIVEKR